MCCHLRNFMCSNEYFIHSYGTGLIFSVGCNLWRYCDGLPCLSKHRGVTDSTTRPAEKYKSFKYLPQQQQSAQMFCDVCVGKPGDLSLSLSISCLNNFQFTSLKPLVNRRLAAISTKNLGQLSKEETQKAYRLRCARAQP